MLNVTSVGDISDIILTKPKQYVEISKPLIHKNTVDNEELTSAIE